MEEEVKKLLALKAEFKQTTGQDWKPGVVQESSSAPPPSSSSSFSSSAVALNQSIGQQGDKVRDLKSKKADKVAWEGVCMSACMAACMAVCMAPCMAAFMAACMAAC